MSLFAKKPRQFKLLSDGEKYAIQNEEGKLLYFSTVAEPFFMFNEVLNPRSWVEKELAETTLRRLCLVHGVEQ